MMFGQGESNEKFITCPSGGNQIRKDGRGFYCLLDAVCLRIASVPLPLHGNRNRPAAAEAYAALCQPTNLPIALCPS